ncbi:MAG: porin family protein [Cyclobacteriaceae bacterium]|nr:porin family protein [Cyclobacteriaceae bacterium]
MSDKHAGVQIETNFAQRGWIVNDTTSGKDIDTVNAMNYFEMPMLSHINIGGGKLRGLFNLGPYLGYALSRQVTVKNGITGAEDSWDYQFDNDKDGRVDFGLAVGAGFEYRFSFGKFAAEARYLFGFGDVDKQKESQSEVSQFRVANLLFRLTVPLKKEKPNPPSDPQ